MLAGTLGDSAAGLAILAGYSRGSWGCLLSGHRHSRPTPRILQGQALRDPPVQRRDLSDGLMISDLGHILRQQLRGAFNDLEALPDSKNYGDMPRSRTKFR